MAEGPDRVFEAIWAQTAKILPVESFSIALCGPGPNQISYEMVVDRGVRQLPQIRELGDGLSDLVVRTGKPLLVRNFELEKGNIPLSWMGAPMVVGDKVLGLLSVQSYRQGVFDQRDLSILSILANWAASAVESVQHYRSQKQEAEASAALLRVTRALGKETELAGLFRSLTEIVPTVVECSHCSVWTWIADKREFHPAWHSSALNRKAEGFSAAGMKLEDFAALAEMLSTREVMVVEESDNGHLTDVEDLLGSAVGPMAFVPLATEGEFVGQIVVGRPRASVDFTPREVDLLRGLADIASLAIQNQRHYRQASETAALRNLSETKSRLISTISHELRTPLSFVQAGSELLMQRLFDPEQLRQVAGLVNQGSSRLAEVVDDIIEFADLQSGAVVLSPLPTYPTAVVRDAIEDAAGASYSDRVLLEAAEPLPVVKVDGEKLKSVVVRLVRNALHFSQDTSVVLVRISTIGDRLKIEISDTGFGIPAEEMDRVFEPFFRGEVSQSRCIPGTGLGLSIVKQLIDVMGGEVAVQSEVDRGTAVVVSIPVNGQSQPALGTESAVAPLQPS